MNLNFKNSKRIGIIIGIVLFIFLAVGVTYAVIAWRTTDYNVTLNSKCLVEGNFTKSENISGEDLLLIEPSDEIYHNQITIKKGMVLSNFSVWKDSTSDCSINGYLRIALNVTSLPSAYMENGDNTNALQYALFYYDPEEYPSVNSNDLDGETFNTLTKGYITNTGTKEIYYDTLLDDNIKKNYILAIYLDGNLVHNNAGDTNFAASIEVSVEQKAGNMPDVPVILPSYNDITDFEYEIVGTNINLNKYIGESKIVSIPPIYELEEIEYTTKMNGYTEETCSGNPETCVSDEYTVFAELTNIEEVYFDREINITDFSSYFEGCTSLKIVPNILSTVTNMNSTFKGCTNLEGNIRINSSDITDVTDAFMGTVKNITIEVPEGSTTYNTFMADENLPNNVTVVTYSK